MRSPFKDFLTQWLLSNKKPHYLKLCKMLKNLIFSEQSDSYYKQTHSKINQSFSKWQHQQLFVYIWDYLWHVLCVLRQLNTIECTTSNCWQKSKHQSYFEFAMRYIWYMYTLMLIFFLSFDLIFFLLHYLCHLLYPFVVLGKNLEKSV